MKRKNNMVRFLQVSLAAVLCVSLGAFALLNAFINRQSAEAIREVGRIYMSGLSDQINRHFRTVVQLRISQIEAMDQAVSQVSGEEEARRRLAEYAGQREFDYLALLCPDGTLEMICGGKLDVLDAEQFLHSLDKGEQRVAAGVNARGERVVLLGVPAEYPLKDGRTSTALVGGLPVSYITDTLSLDEDSTQVYSFIIQRDGSFVLRTNDAFRESYFERVRSLYEGVDPEDYLEELTYAMDTQGVDFSSSFTIFGETRQVYGTGLAYSDWYLMTFMPYAALDNVVDRFLARSAVLILGACLVVLVALLVVFARYFKMNSLQMQELEHSRYLAEEARQMAEDACREAEEARQAAEEAQQRAERASKAKSEFLSNMSHDIRTPMNAVVGMTSIAAANIDNPEQVRSCLKKITLSSKHLLGLINDVLDMSKIESGKMTLSYDRVSLREVMDGVVSIVQPQVRAKKQQFSVSIHDITAENVYCDSVRLNQILINLLSNAVKFTPDEGTVLLALYEEESPQGEEYVRIHIQVKDSGIGMSEEFMAHIFDSFSREDNRRVHRTEGTGLGMAITKYIVDAMGGSITLTSAQGEGSEFRVVLDLEKAENREEDMVLPDWNMLVVDDDPQLCESAVASLRAIGIKADWTYDGESALELVAARRGKLDEYQIILLDWKLPGLDGIETARRIRQGMGGDIPILLISAYDWSEIEEEAKSAGINGFISKPLFKSTLYHGLKPYLIPEKPEEEKPEEETDLSGRHILLAEDNELNWEIASELLSELGLKLEWAENGQECVDKFLASQPGDFDAILMDLRMPVMNGYEATQAIRASQRPDAGLPIIAMTADAFAEDAKRCLEAGMNAHVAKPIDVREVVRLLEKYLEK